MMGRRAKRVAAALAAALCASGLAAGQTTVSRLPITMPADQAPAVAAIQQSIGVLSASGHTTTPITLSFPAVAIGGTTLVASGIVDPKSGQVPPVGAMCIFGTSGATPFSATMLIRCTVTAPGTVSITAQPLGGLALGASSLTGNVFWLW